MKILIVDDDEITLNVLEDCLTEAGYEVLTALNGQEALKIVHEQDIQLVITDWNMPVMDGLEFCNSIRNADLSSYIYIILLTALNQKEDILIGLSAGADDYLIKPCDEKELILRVHIGERVLSSKIQGVTIFALAKLAESRDPETGLHLERVRRYCWITVIDLSKTDKYKDFITRDYCNNLFFTSCLHDIGKVCIPDRILLKPGKLNSEEWSIMKTHSARGAETIQAILEKYKGLAFLEMSRDITFCHHEKYDGSGYPLGLKGEEIPLSAQIMALADVYDAMTNKRVYKKAFTHEKTRSYIVENSGKHFDPNVVRAFLTSEKQFIEIFNQLRNDKPPQKEIFRLLENSYRSK